MRIGTIVLLALTATAPVVPLESAEPDAPKLAQSLQHRYDGIRDFSADFVHVYQGGVLRKQLTEKGRLLIKKPGKMRWTYTAPEEKLFVSDAVKIYSYIPQDKQVTVMDVPPDDTASAPALFLAGKGNLVRDFTPSFAVVPAGTDAGTTALRLVPKTPQADYDWLVLLVDSGTLALRGLSSSDAQGGTSTFSFTHLKENIGLADKEFAFRIPNGVDIVTNAGHR